MMQAGINLNIFGAIAGAFSSKSSKQQKAESDDSVNQVEQYEQREELAKVKGEFLSV